MGVAVVVELASTYALTSAVIKLVRLPPSTVKLTTLVVILTIGLVEFARPDELAGLLALGPLDSVDSPVLVVADSLKVLALAVIPSPKTLALYRLSRSLASTTEYRDVVEVMGPVAAVVLILVLLGAAVLVLMVELEPGETGDAVAPLTDTVAMTLEHVAVAFIRVVLAMSLIVATEVCVGMRVLMDKVLARAVGNADGELGDVALHMPLLCRNTSHHSDVEV